MTTLTTLGSNKILVNKYYHWYMSIVNHRLTNQIIGGYYESHHVIPRSMGGSNRNDNLVNLTSREHFICHLLLTKFTIGKNKHSMLFALNCMRMKSCNHNNRYFNSRMYEYLKVEFSYICKDAMILK